MIARRQQRNEDRAARVSGPVLVCDTDALATCIWQERYMGRSTGAVERIAASRSYALSVLTQRRHPVRAGRAGVTASTCAAAMTQRFRDRLRGPWIEVRGSVDERVDQVLERLARMFSRT